MEGGMIVTDNEELYHILLSLRAHGWTRNLPEVNHVAGVRGNDPFYESFRFVLPGYNLRPLEFEGAIGLQQLRKLPNMIRERRANADRFKTVMSRFEHISTQTEIGKSSWFGFSIMLDKEADVCRDKLVSELSRLGFECRPIVAGNFAKNEVIKYFDYEVHDELANANHLHTHGLFIGNQPFPMIEEFDALESLNLPLA